MSAQRRNQRGPSAEACTAAGPHVAAAAAAARAAAAAGLCMLCVLMPASQMAARLSNSCLPLLAPQCGLVNGTVTGLDAAAGECVPCADASCIDCAADYQKCTQVTLNRCLCQTNEMHTTRRACCSKPCQRPEPAALLFSSPPRLKEPVHAVRIPSCGAQQR